MVRMLQASKRSSKAGPRTGKWHLSNSRHQQNLDIAVYVDVASVRGI